MQCNKCEHELRENDIFCSKCGNKNENIPNYSGSPDTYFEGDVPSDMELNMSIPSDDPSSMVQATIVTENISEEINEMPPFSNGPNEAPKQKLTKSSTIMVIIVSCLTLAIIALVGIHVLTGSNDEKEISNQIQGFLDETSQLDLEGMSQYVTPDVAERLVFVNNIKTALSEVLGADVDSPDSSPLEITAESINVQRVVGDNGDVAYVETELEFKIMGISAGYDTTFEMNKIDGEWLIKDIKLRILNFNQG